eukprot:403334533
MEIKQAKTLGGLQANKYPIKNAVSVQMPQYLVSNPYTHIQNDQKSLGLSKNVNLQKYQQVQKPIVKINTNQRFGLSKDTPFQSNYIEYNQNTQAILNKDQAMKDEKSKLQKQLYNTQIQNLPQKAAQVQRTLVETQVKKAIMNKVFTKLSNSSLSQDQQKRVMLLYNKDAQINIMKNEQFLDKLTQQKEQSLQSQTNNDIKYHTSPTLRQNTTMSNGNYDAQSPLSTMNPQLLSFSSKQIESDVQSQINSIQKTNRKLRQVDKQVLNFYWNVNTSRDNMSSSLINQIQNEKINMPYDTESHHFKTQKISSNQFPFHQNLKQNIQVSTQRTNDSQFQNEQQFITSNFGQSDAFNSIPHPYIEQQQQDTLKTRTQSAFTTQRQNAPKSLMFGAGTNTANSNMYQDFDRTGSKLQSRSTNRRSQLSSQSRTQNNSNLLGVNKFEKVMNEINHIANLGKQSMRSNQRTDVKSLILQSYDQQRDFMRAQEQEVLSNRLNATQFQLKLSTQQRQSSKVLNNQQTRQQKASCDTIIKKGEFNLGALNKNSNANSRSVFDQKEIKPEHSTFAINLTPTNKQVHSRQNSRPRSQYVHRNTTRIIQTEQKPMNVTQNEFIKNLVNEQENGNQKQLNNSSVKVHYSSQQQVYKHQKHDSMINLKSEDYFNIQENDKEVNELGDLSPFNDYNDEYKLSQLTLSDKIQILNKATPNKSRTYLQK